MNGEARPDVADEWLAAMRRGDWEAAWRATDRLELPRRAARNEPGFRRGPDHLRWDGTPPAGRAVLVRCEHGLGDTLQFMRFVPLLRAAHVHFMVQPHLLALLRDAPGLGEVRNYWTDDPLPPHEVDLEVMELPYALRITLPSLPGPYPHLREQLARRPGFDLPDEGHLRVGLLWAASDWDGTRSIPVEALAPLFALGEVRFFSLQQGTAAEDQRLRQFDVECLSPRTREIPAAAAAMDALDLVIAVDGMPAHLAATLDRPTWVLLKNEADWRWMEGGEDTPWYPAMRLFRQPRAGDWGAVVEQVAQSLRRVAAARSPSFPRRRESSALGPRLRGDDAVTASRESSAAAAAPSPPPSRPR